MLRCITTTYNNRSTTFGSTSKCINTSVTLFIALCFVLPGQWLSINMVGYAGNLPVNISLLYSCKCMHGKTMKINVLA